MHTNAKDAVGLCKGSLQGRTESGRSESSSKSAPTTQDGLRPSPNPFGYYILVYLGTKNDTSRLNL